MWWVAAAVGRQALTLNSRMDNINHGHKAGKSYVVSKSFVVPKVMVFYPTMEEFMDFDNYIKYMESQGAHEAGIAKVVSPTEWAARRDGYANLDLVIPSPVEQFVSGKTGKYQLENFHQHPIHIQQFEELAFSKTYEPPIFKNLEDMERKYWGSITKVHPLFGTDISSSLYDADQDIWNVGRLGTILDFVKEDYNAIIEGVNTPYLYVGMWKSTFPWHTEDMNLYSIDYLHFGAPKVWYAVPTAYSRQMENLATELFPTDSENCSNYLQHKSVVLPPATLKSNGIPCETVLQECGDFIVTFPHAYHSGFNAGFNCSESANFASLRWIEYGKRATQCTCSNASSIGAFSMHCFVKRFQSKNLGSDDQSDDSQTESEHDAEEGECVATPMAFKPLTTAKKSRKSSATLNSQKRFEFLTKSTKSFDQPTELEENFTEADIPDVIGDSNLIGDPDSNDDTEEDQQENFDQHGKFANIRGDNDLYFGNSDEMNEADVLDDCDMEDDEIYKMLTAGLDLTADPGGNANKKKNLNKGKKQVKGKSHEKVSVLNHENNEEKLKSGKTKETKNVRKDETSVEKSSKMAQSIGIEEMKSRSKNLKQNTKKNSQQKTKADCPANQKAEMVIPTKNIISKVDKKEQLTVKQTKSATKIQNKKSKMTANVGSNKVINKNSSPPTRGRSLKLEAADSNDDTEEDEAETVIPTKKVDKKEQLTAKQTKSASKNQNKNASNVVIDKNSSLSTRGRSSKLEAADSNDDTEENETETVIPTKKVDKKEQLTGKQTKSASKNQNKSAKMTTNVVVSNEITNKNSSLSTRGRSLKLEAEKEEIKSVLSTPAENKKIKTRKSLGDEIQPKSDLKSDKKRDIMSEETRRTRRRNPRYVNGADDSYEGEKLESRQSIVCDAGLKKESTRLPVTIERRTTRRSLAAVKNSEEIQSSVPLPDVIPVDKNRKSLSESSMQRKVELSPVRRSIQRSRVDSIATNTVEESEVSASRINKGSKKRARVRTDEPKLPSKTENDGEAMLKIPKEITKDPTSESALISKCDVSRKQSIPSRRSLAVGGKILKWSKSTGRDKTTMPYGLFRASSGFRFRRLRKNWSDFAKNRLLANKFLSKSRKFDSKLAKSILPVVVRKPPLVDSDAETELGNFSENSLDAMSAVERNVASELLKIDDTHDKPNENSFEESSDMQVEMDRTDEEHIDNDNGHRATRKSGKFVAATSKPLVRRSSRGTIVKKEHLEALSEKSLNTTTVRKNPSKGQSCTNVDANEEKSLDEEIVDKSRETSSTSRRTFSHIKKKEQVTSTGPEKKHSDDENLLMSLSRKESLNDSKVEEKNSRSQMKNSKRSLDDLYIKVVKLDVTTMDDVTLAQRPVTRPKSAKVNYAEIESASDSDEPVEKRSKRQSTSKQVTIKRLQQSRCSGNEFDLSDEEFSLLENSSKPPADKTDGQIANHNIPREFLKFLKSNKFLPVGSALEQMASEQELETESEKSNSIQQEMECVKTKDTAPVEFLKFLKSKGSIPAGSHLETVASTIETEEDFEPPQKRIDLLAKSYMTAYSSIASAQSNNSILTFSENSNSGQYPGTSSLVDLPPESNRNDVAQTNESVSSCMDQVSIALDPTTGNLEHLPRSKLLMTYRTTRFVLQNKDPDVVSPNSLPPVPPAPRIAPPRTVEPICIDLTSLDESDSPADSRVNSSTNASEALNCGPSALPAVQVIQVDVDEQQTIAPTTPRVSHAAASLEVPRAATTPQVSFATSTTDASCASTAPQVSLLSHLLTTPQVSCATTSQVSCATTSQVSYATTSQVSCATTTLPVSYTSSTTEVPRMSPDASAPETLQTSGSNGIQTTSDARIETDIFIIQPDDEPEIQIIEPDNIPPARQSRPAVRRRAENLSDVIWCSTEAGNIIVID